MIPKTLILEFRIRVLRNSSISNMDSSKNKTRIKRNKKFAFFGYRVPAKKETSVDFCT
jgi:hypothetical protein